MRVALARPYCSGSSASAVDRRGLPTEATVAHVLVSKYADHLPLYRQAQIYSRQGIDLDRSTLASWVGKAAYELKPVFDALTSDLKRSTKLFMDETRAPVLDPGRGKPKRVTSGHWRVMTGPGAVRIRPVLPSPMRRGDRADMLMTSSAALPASCRSMAMRVTIDC